MVTETVYVRVEKPVNVIKRSGRKPAGGRAIPAVEMAKIMLERGLCPHWVAIARGMEFKRVWRMKKKMEEAP